MVRSKYIADTGICNRREADKLITSGDILVNGQQVKKLGALIRPDAEVSYKGKVITRKQSTYILFNLPAEEKTAEHYIENIEKQFSQKVKPVHLFDKLVSGLVLFSNDQKLIEKLTNKELKIQNKYKVELDKEVSSNQLNELNSIFHKVDYADTTTKKTLFIITRTSTQEKELLKCFEKIAINILSIDRIEYGPLKKGALSRSKSRELSTKEIGFLKMLKG